MLGETERAKERVLERQGREREEIITEKKDYWIIDLIIKLNLIYLFLNILCIYINKNNVKIFSFDIFKLI